MSFRTALRELVSFDGNRANLTTQDLTEAAKRYDRDGDPTTLTAAEVNDYLERNGVSEYHPFDGDRRDVRDLFGLVPGSPAKHTPQQMIEYALSGPRAERPRGLLANNAGVKIRR